MNGASRRRPIRSACLPDVGREQPRPAGEGHQSLFGKIIGVWHDTELGQPQERAPRRDTAGLVAGAGLSAVGKIADPVETLFDSRSGQQIERDERAHGREAHDRTNHRGSAA